MFTFTGAELVHIRDLVSDELNKIGDMEDSDDKGDAIETLEGIEQKIDNEIGY